MNALFLNAKCFVGLPKSNDFGALRLFVAHSIPTIAHGINGWTLRGGADSADKRHETLCSVFWFTPDWRSLARKCFSSIWLPWINKNSSRLSCFCLGLIGLNHRFRVLATPKWKSYLTIDRLFSCLIHCHDWSLWPGARSVSSAFGAWFTPAGASSFLHHSRWGCSYCSGLWLFSHGWSTLVGVGSKWVRCHYRASWPSRWISWPLLLSIESLCQDTFDVAIIILLSFLFGSYSFKHFVFNNLRF